MQRLLPHAPKGFKHEILGHLTRATLSVSKEYEPFDSGPGGLHYCPVCGDIADKNSGIAVVLFLRFADSQEYTFVGWAHPDCFKGCVLTDEPDADLE
jgi:hypothetical protein